MSDTCERCDQVADILFAVETLPATCWSPAEHEWICRACVQQAQDRAEQDEERRSLKGYSDEELERI